MIARKVAELLKASAHLAFALSRRPVNDPLFAGYFQWDPEKKTFDAAAFSDMDAVIHLAGAGIADTKWTPARKKEIISSRTQSAAFLAEQLRIVPNNIRTIVAASATGFYGNPGQELMHETAAAGKGFLAEACTRWEESLHGLALPNIRLTILRIGFVIDRNGGALPVMARPVRLCVGAPYGSGKQYISWIDSNDLSRLFLHALTDASMKGTYNAVAPDPVTNVAFIKAIGKRLRRPAWPFGIPSAVFKVMLGEQSELVLGGQRVSADKVLAAGFKFEFKTLDDSLKNHL